MLTPQIALYALSRTRNKMLSLPSTSFGCAFLNLDIGPVFFFAGILRKEQQGTGGWQG